MVGRTKMRRVATVSKRHVKVSHIKSIHTHKVVKKSQPIHDIKKMKPLFAPEPFIKAEPILNVDDLEISSPQWLEEIREITLPKNINKVEIFKDGFDGIIRINEKELKLDIRNEFNYKIILRANGFVIVHIPKHNETFELKFSGFQTNEQGFQTLLRDMRYGRITVHQIFSDIISQLVKDISYCQGELLLKRDPHRFASLYIHENNLRKLMIALLASKPSKVSTEILQSINTQSELNRFIEIASNSM